MNSPTKDKYPEKALPSRLDDLRRHFRNRELARHGKIAALLAFGLPALLLGPVVISSLYWSVGFIWSFYVPWTWVFLVSLLVVVPSLFWTEWRSGGSYYSDAILAGGASPDDSPRYYIALGEIGALAALARNPQIVVELFLWGPRQILEAIRTKRTMRNVASASRMRAAEIVSTLQSRDGMEVAGLMPAGDSITGMAMAYLVQYEWIGISKDRRKVWIDTASRKTLEQ